MTAARPRSWLSPGRILQAVLVLGVLAFLFLHRSEWPRIVDAARSAQPGFLVLAAALEVCWLLAFGVDFWAGMRMVGINLPVRRAMVVAWGANFVNMLVKSGGMGGLAIWLREGGRRGHPPARVTLGYLFTIALGHTMFLVLLALAVAVLWLRGGAGRVELIASAATFAALSTGLAAGVWVLVSPVRIARGYGVAAAVINRAARLVRRRQLLDPEGGTHAGEEARAVLSLVRGAPSRAFPAILASMARETLAVFVLWATLRAFYPGATPVLALLAYVLTILFSYASVLPGGLGVVEVSLTALLVRSGMGGAEAGLATILYRLAEFWSPLLTGAVASRFAVGGAPVPVPDDALAAGR